MTQFKTIGIIGRVRTQKIKETLKILIDFLHQLNQAVLVEIETAEAIKEVNLPTIARDELGKQCDLLIVIGGDGSLLHAAHAVIGQPIPVLGINRGSLGFLTDIHPTKLEKIKMILEGDYILEKRFLLTAFTELHNKSLGQGDALNEVALIHDAIPHMIEFEIYIDEQFVCSQHSDGLIIATPTGSTAYALSAGGPIVHPALDAMVIVPMFPHTLSNRPIVIDGNAHIHIVVTPNNVSSPRLTCDSQSWISTPAGSHIHIQKKIQPLHLIHARDYNYYETLRSKLHWGKKLQYME